LVEIRETPALVTATIDRKITQADRTESLADLEMVEICVTTKVRARVNTTTMVILPEKEAIIATEHQIGETVVQKEVAGAEMSETTIELMIVETVVVVIEEMMDERDTVKAEKISEGERSDLVEAK
jgi:hypothetical protein